MKKKHLIIAGHGRRKDGTWDPGARGILGGEHKYMTDKLFPAMKKYAGDNFIFYSARNVFSYGDLVTLTKRLGADTVTEMHYDAFNGKASGGHVIIHSAYGPDAMDLRIRDVIKDMTGLRFSHRGHAGISGRSNLGNVNRARNGGINYRMVELGFGDNPKDARIMTNQVDEYARKLVGAIQGSKVSISSTSTSKVGWVENKTGWWYQNADGSYPHNQWQKINGTWYLFDSRGYMLKGWQKVKDTWYYMDNSGAMQTGWVKLKDVWYYLNSNGSMTTGWQKVNNRWYYMNNSGVMQTGLITIGGKHYYLERSGALITDESVELEANKHGHLK